MSSSLPADAREERQVRLRFRDWRFRVRDVIASVTAALEYTEGMTYEEFVADRRTRDAVIRNLTTMGESVRWIPGPIREANPEVPWTIMRGVRNVVVHEYFGVTLETLWKTASEDLPGLVEPLRRLLAES